MLFLINGLGTGGAERSLAELLGPLSERGHRPVVARFHEREAGVEASIRADGYEVHAIEAGRLPGRVTAVRRLVRSVRPDLVHSTLFEANQVARLAVLGTGTPLLTSLVNTSYGRTRTRPDRGAAARLRAVQLVDRVTARRTTHFHAISQAVADDAIAHLSIPPDRVTVIHRGRERRRLGWPSDARRRAAREGLGVDPSAPVIVVVGREEVQKGQVHLVGALPAVLARHPDAVLLMAGRPGHASMAIDAAIVSAGVGEHVRRLGHRDDVAEVLAAGDVFAFPSLWEGLGGSVLEAMALALPVVASDLPALREVVDPGPGGTARLVPAGDAQALGEAIADVLADPERAAMGQRGLERFEERFTLERSAAAMVDLIETVAGE